MSQPPTESAQSLAKGASPYGYSFWDWVAREDPDYVTARKPITDLSVGEGKALALKYREMVIIGILAYRGVQEDFIVAHMKRAIEHGASKRELLEAMQSAAVPGGGPCFAAGAQALMRLDKEGAFGR